MSLILAFIAISLGLKGFSENGLPLTKKKNLTGKTAKIIGTVCIIIGVAFSLNVLAPLAAILISEATH